MRRILSILLILMPTAWLCGQDQTMLIHKKGGELMSISVGQIDSVRFVSTGNVQRNKWYFMLENPGIADYLRDFDYPSDDYSFHNIFAYRGEPYLDSRQDWPYGVELADTIIYNLIPNRHYSIQAEGQEWSFNTLGQLRMLKLEGVNNVRDLGGWPLANGHTLRYGCIIRGAELNTTLPSSHPMATLHQASASDIQMLRQVVGIRAELDLRAGSEIPSLHSAMGDDIRYKNCPQCTPSPIYGPDQAWTEPMQFVTECLKEGRSVYVHCRWGADRTGLFCMLIEGLLGVSESNLAKDFELTSFAGDSRFRTDTRFRQSIAYIKSLPGQDLQEQFHTYWLTCGAKEEELQQLIELLTE